MLVLEFALYCGRWHFHCKALTLHNKLFFFSETHYFIQFPKRWKLMLSLQCFSTSLKTQGISPQKLSSQASFPFSQAFLHQNVTVKSGFPPFSGSLNKLCPRYFQYPIRINMCTSSLPFFKVYYLFLLWQTLTLYELFLIWKLKNHTNLNILQMTWTLYFHQPWLLDQLDHTHFVATSHRRQWPCYSRKSHFHSKSTQLPIFFHIYGLSSKMWLKVQ